VREEQLKFLKEIACVKSITAASANLNITPQALSSSIKTLEKELNFQVLIRSNQGVSLTPEGIKLITCADDFFNAINEIRFIEMIRNDQEKTILPITREASSYFALPLIREFISTSENLNIELMMDSVEILKEKVIQKMIPGFFTVVPEYEGEYFLDEKIADDTFFKRFFLKPIGRLYCLVPNETMLYNFKTISLKTIIDYPSIFRKTNYEDSSSIFHMLNRIKPIVNYEFVEDPMEYKLKLLLGSRISYEFINEFSEWRLYSELLNIIQLKEKFLLHMCIITSVDESIEAFMPILKNTCLEKDFYEIL